MGRPATQHEARKEQIVIAALECFARYGFQGTTNKLIAQAAGLNSAALIYHYFPSKEDLFRACLYSFSVLDSMKESLEKVYDLPPRDFLLVFGGFYLKILRTTPISKLVPMMMGAVQSQPELVPVLVERIETAIWLPLSHYLKQQMEKGVVRKMSDATILQLFLGPIVIRMLSNTFLQESSIQDTDSDEEFLGHLVDTFLEGVLLPSSD